MYDTKLTEEPFCGTQQLKKSCRRIFTAEGKLVGGLTNRRIYDLNGKTLAKAKEKEKKKNGSGETEQVIIYRGEAPRGGGEEGFERQSAERSEDGTEFQLIGNRVYRNGEYIGKAEEGRKRSPLIIGSSFTALVALILAIILLLLLLIDTPSSEIPIVSVRDSDGYWGEGKIAVLGDEVSPGRNGSYSFVIENPLEEELSYSFRIQAVYNGETLSGEDADKFPLLFRLKMNNAYIVTTDWLTVEQLFYSDMIFLADTQQSFALEWEWPFENGQDDLDTRYGIENGEIALTLTLTAETLS